MKTTAAISIIFLIAAISAPPARAVPAAFLDHRFLALAADGALLDIGLGNLATSHSVNPEIQKFGRNLAATQTSTLEDTERLAATYRFTMPSNVTLVQQRVLQRFIKTFGTPFDRAFVAFSIQTLGQEINLYSQASTNAWSPAVRAFSREEVPVLTQLLNTAVQLRQSWG
jgi:predicted outer membrane protein